MLNYMGLQCTAANDAGSASRCGKDKRTRCVVCVRCGSCVAASRLCCPSTSCVVNDGQDFNLAGFERHTCQAQGEWRRQQLMMDEVLAMRVAGLNLDGGTSLAGRNKSLNPWRWGKRMQKWR